MQIGATKREKTVLVSRRHEPARSWYSNYRVNHLCELTLLYARPLMAPVLYDTRASEIQGAHEQALHE